MKPKVIPFRVKVSSKGQVVIPKPLRDAYNIKEGSDVFMIPVKNGILIKVLPVKRNGLRGLLADLDVNVKECEAILTEAKKMLSKVVIDEDLRG